MPKAAAFGIVLGLSGLFVIPAPAQTPAAQEGGSQLTFGLRTSLVANDNPDLRISGGRSALSLDNALSLDYQTRTRTGLFRFGLDGILRAGGGRDQDSGFTEPGARLHYERETVDSRIEAGARWRRLPVSRGVFLDDFFPDPGFPEVPDETDLISDRGDRTIESAYIRGEFRRDAPLGFELDARHDGRRYSGTTDPGLFDTRRQSVGAGVRLRFSPVTEGRFRLRQEDYHEDNAAEFERRTRTASFGVSHQLDEATALDVTLGYQDIHTRDITGTLIERDGLMGSLGARRALPDGYAGANLDVVQTEHGARSTVSATRSYDLPRGNLTATLGATRTAFGKTVPVGGIDYRHDTLDGSFFASLHRRVLTSSQDNEIESTRLSLGYRHVLDPVSSIDLRGDYIRQDDTGSGRSRDYDNAMFRASYNRALTRDWSVSTGYEHRYRSENAGTARSNAVFVTLGRDFTVRF